MKSNLRLVFSVIVVFAVIIGAVVFFADRSTEMGPNSRDAHGCKTAEGYAWCEKRNVCLRASEQYCTDATPKTVMFTCDEEKSVVATFFPSDDNFVDLIFSDGRRFSLPHAMSASGARYANADESTVFWNKGDTAFVTEGKDAQQTFKNCRLAS